MEVLVISLKSSISPHILKVFPEAKLHPAVDARQMDPVQLQQDGVLSATAAFNLARGRKYHYEISGLGAVGLYLSVREALKRTPDTALLLIEEDCLPSQRLPDVCRALLRRASEFDVAVHGPLRVDDHSPSSVHPEFGRLKGFFWCTHAVLYTPHGRAATLRGIEGEVDMQIDGKLSVLNEYFPVVGTPPLRVMVQIKGEMLASQRRHSSTIQTQRHCIVCNISPSQGDHFVDYIAHTLGLPVMSLLTAGALGALGGLILRR